MKIKLQIEDFMPCYIELTQEQVNILCTNSIERVFNTAIEIVSESDHENSLTSEEDLRALKMIATYFWYSAQNAVIAKGHGMKESDFGK